MELNELAKALGLSEEQVKSGMNLFESMEDSVRQELFARSVEVMLVWLGEVLARVERDERLVAVDVPAIVARSALAQTITERRLLVAVCYSMLEVMRDGAAENGEGQGSRDTGEMVRGEGAGGKVVLPQAQDGARAGKVNAPTRAIFIPRIDFSD